MKTLELKDLKHYLGTGLKIDGCQSKLNCNILQRFIDGDWDVVPLMLPLSALTEPLPGGSIPIVELAKIERGNYDVDQFIVGEIGEFRYFTNHAAFNNDAHICIYESGIGRMKHVLNYNQGNGFNTFYCFKSDMQDVDLRVLNNQLQLFEYLYANHFWLGDQSLFETGEIIDKRTLK